MNLAKQKLLLEHMVSSKDLYARTSAIIKPSYFDIEYKRVMTLIHAYYQMYSNLPSLDVIKAECDVILSHKEMNHNEFVYWCDECESFAKQAAMKAALQASVTDMVDGNFDKIYESVSNALKISLNRDLGVDLYASPRETLDNCNEALDFIPTGIAALDDKLGGGLVRQQMTLVSANSGVGKSVIMANIGNNVSRNGYHVLYISLELAENMIFTRLSSIATGEDISTWRSNIPKLAIELENIKATENVASYIVKRMPNGSTTNDIRSYLKQYQLKFDILPDVILIDYLDRMQPNGGTKGLAVHEQDNLKSEQLYEIGIETNAAILTASQQNRSGITNAAPDQTVIAGGFSKINVVDNYISLKMDDMMRLEGIMLLHFLKTRSSSAVGSSIPLKFNASNLQITDIDDMSRVTQLLKRLESNNKNESKSFTNNKQNVTITRKIDGLPSHKNDERENNPKQDLIDFISEL